MSGPVFRKDFEKGARMAECLNCGMGWCEYEEPVELLPGHWTGCGERAHECPKPLPYEVALSMVQTARGCGGIVVSQRMKAQIRLGLRSKP